MAEDARPRLGRGLAALMGEAVLDEPQQAADRNRGGAKRIPIEFLKPNPKNPRRHFSDDLIAELSESIREKGIIQPILVRAVPRVADAYEIIAGERRWRAAQRAGLREVPALVIEANDRDALEIAIVENVQRADLNPIEEAHGYRQLAEEFSYSQADLARIIGKSRSHIANTLRLLKLSDGTRDMVVNGELSAGHARALLSVAHPDAVAKRIVAESLTVRDVERIAQGEAAGPAPKANSLAVPKPEKSADIKALERSLTEALGMNVLLTHRNEGGELTVKYSNLEQLDMVCRRLEGRH